MQTICTVLMIPGAKHTFLTAVGDGMSWKAIHKLLLEVITTASERMGIEPQSDLDYQVLSKFRDAVCGEGNSLAETSQRLALLVTK